MWVLERCCYYSGYNGLTKGLQNAYLLIKLLLQYSISDFALELKLIVVILNRELLIEEEKNPIHNFSLT